MDLGYGDLRRLAAELFGTMIIVLFGGMAIVAVTETNAPVVLAVPTGYAVALFVGLVTVGSLSGGHFNPAVTLGALLDRRLSVARAGGYVVAQVLGAFLGVLAFLAVGAAAVVNTPDVRSAAAGIGTRPVAPPEFAFIAEVILTALLVLVYLTVTRRNAVNSLLVLLAVPLTYFAINAIGAPFSAASVNPARSLAPALVSLHEPTLSVLWIYLTAPFVGAAVGWLLYRFFSAGEADEALVR